MDSEHNQPEQQPAASEQLIEAGTLLDEAWRHFKDSFHEFAPLSIGLLAVITLQQIATRSPSVILSSIAFIAGTILTMYGYLAMLLILTRDRNLPFRPDDSYRHSLELIGPYFFVAILSFLVSVGAGVFLIIPALIANVFLTFAAFAFIEGKRGIDALAQSWHYVRNHWWAVAFRLLAYLAIFIICYVAFAFVFTLVKIPFYGLAGAVTPAHTLDEVVVMNAFETFLMVPFSIVYLYRLYVDLKSIQPAVRSEEADRKTHKLLTVLAGIGAVVVILGSIAYSYFVLRYGSVRLVPPQTTSFLRR